MIDAPFITVSEPRLIAYIPLKVPTVEIRHHMGAGIAEVLAAIKDQGIEQDGPWFTFHNRPPNEWFDYEICVPVKTPVTPVGRVIMRELPAVRVARTTYRGPYEGLGGGWGALMKWIGAEGLSYHDALWEIYRVGPESGEDSARFETELNRPLI